VKHRFTVHGLRYTFTELIRLSNADAVVGRALTGHVTQEMQHYSHVGSIVIPRSSKLWVRGHKPPANRLNWRCSDPS